MSKFEFSATTPRQITPAILEFCNSITPDYQPFYQPVIGGGAADPNGVRGHCYQNVRRMIWQHGGHPQYGFCIWEEPGVFLNAEHHCIWHDGEQFVDVSPPMEGEKRVLFLPTADIGETDEFLEGEITPNRAVPNLFFPLSTRKDILAQVEMRRQREWLPVFSLRWQRLDAQICQSMKAILRINHKPIEERLRIKRNKQRKAERKRRKSSRR